MDSKIKLRIEIEGEGACIERLAEALESFFRIERPPVKPAPTPFSRPENIPPRIIRRANGHDLGD